MANQNTPYGCWWVETPTKAEKDAIPKVYCIRPCTHVGRTTYNRDIFPLCRAVRAMKTEFRAEKNLMARGLLNEGYRKEKMDALSKRNLYVSDKTFAKRAKNNRPKNGFWRGKTPKYLSPDKSYVDWHCWFSA